MLAAITSVISFLAYGRCKFAYLHSNTRDNEENVIWYAYLHKMQLKYFNVNILTYKF